jgi:UDP-4-amino-4,6-dideoxy-N-acetyl-beta-L-altrosamine N-acetyltransferase
MSKDPRELVRGKHVYLREMEESDAPHIVEWRNRPDTKQWLVQWEPLTVKSHIKWMKQRREAGDLLLMFDSLEGEPVAMTSLQDFDPPGTSAEWGRLCARSIGGNRHATLEGCYLLHRMCFDALHMFRLIGTVAAANERPYRLYQFLGYQDEGLRRKHVVYQDGYFDIIEIGLFEEEWEAARPQVEAKLYPDGDVPVISEELAEDIRRRIPLGQRQAAEE